MVIGHRVPHKNRINPWRVTKTAMGPCSQDIYMTRPLEFRVYFQE